MKLIPPSPVKEVIEADVEKAFEEVAPVEDVVVEDRLAEERETALNFLVNAGEAFAIALATAIEQVEENDDAPKAAALAAILIGATEMVGNMAQGNDAQHVQKGSKMKNGHKGRGTAASRGNGKSRAGSKGTGRGATTARQSTSGASAAGGKKRGRGRPKGSKNKSTLAKEAAARAAKRGTVVPVVAKKKAAVKKVVAARGKAKPANSRKGRQAVGSASKRKTVSRKR